MDWYRNLRTVLLVKDKLPYLEQPNPTLPVLPAGQATPLDVLATHQAWLKASQEIARLMLMTMDPEIQKTLEHLGVYDMLKELETLCTTGKSGTASNRTRIPHVQTRKRIVYELLHSQNEELHRQTGMSWSCHDSKPCFKLDHCLSEKGI
ncbi:hypothetical protein Tco_1500858 [Tanacetum coccineum]